jgi:hypothetical protein
VRLYRGRRNRRTTTRKPHIAGVVHSPDRSEMLAELTRVLRHPETHYSTAAWQLISNQTATVDSLTSLGAMISLVNRASPLPFEYLGFKPATL